MRFTLITLLYTTFSYYATAQHKISGTIRDAETHETLIGATIYIPELIKGTTSDINGQYELGGLPSNGINIEFSFIGYQTQNIHLHLANDSVMNIDLHPTLREMDEVIVTGLSKSMEVKHNPVAATIATAKNLFNYQATNLVDAITAKPGISQVTTGPAISKPIIRGLGSNRVLTLYNGLRQEGQQWGDEHGIEIDEFSIDKIEIIKGPGSIAYGSDAMAGVINFLTPHEAEEGKVSGSINTGYQTNNNQYHISGATSGNLNGINWRGRVTHKQAGNYSNTYDGKVFNSGFNELDWDAQIGINGSWGFSHFYTSRFDQELGLVEGERDSTGAFLKVIQDGLGGTTEVPLSDSQLKGYSIDIPRQRVRHFRIGTSNQFFLKESTLSVKLDYQRNQREEIGDVLDPTARELYFDLHTADYSIQYMLPEKDHWDTSIGLSGMFQKNINRGEEALIPDYQLFDAGIYALTQKEFEQVMVSGGVRLDTRQINSFEMIVDEGGVPTTIFESLNTSFTNLSGSAGLSYRPDKYWNFKFNVARGFRAPTLAELSSNGAHEGSFQYEIGNPNLKAETSLQADLGIDFESDHMTVQVAGFFNHIDNYIYLQKLLDNSGNDSIPDPGSGAIAFHYVQDAANIYGMEAGIDIHPHPLHWLHFANTFALVYARQTNQPDSTKNLPFIPAPEFKSELRADLLKSDRIKNGFVKLGLQYMFAQNRIFSAYNTETVTPAYALLSAGVGGTLVNSKGKPLFQLSILGNNLLDIAYQNHLSRLKYAPENPVTGRVGIFNMGRNFTIKMQIPLQFKE